MKPEKEELTPRDDAVIGRAFRRSLVVLLIVGAVVGGISFLLERHPSAPQTQITHLDTPASPSSTTTALTARSCCPKRWVAAWRSSTSTTMALRTCCSSTPPIGTGTFPRANNQPPSRCITTMAEDISATSLRA